MKFDFLKRVDPTQLTLYPLQLANMERIDRNDAVFIFDEVGCGKTISSGLMALSYLEKNMNTNKKVLVITIKSLIKTDQFKADWYARVPFTEEQKARIRFCNDHVKKIERQGNETWGLIIVDEAQLFLSDQETGKINALKSLKAEKVVFLTATPIRRDERDLGEYAQIAGSILGKDDEWVKHINEILLNITKGSEKIEDNICAQFDPYLPVTRYFKDTVRYLEKAGDQGNFKQGSKRRLAEIWRVGEGAGANAESKAECLFLNMENVLANGEKHHFVVFSTKQQAEELGEYARKRGFVDYYNNGQGQKTYRVVTGDNSAELSNFGGSGKESNPTVLFVNYMIAEQGLNLPGFDYVVNYQISQFPSRLEQRFGRIDRLGKNGKGTYENIKVCYVLSRLLFDSSTWNFYLAMDEYLNSILPFLPSRNMILDESILKELKSAKKVLEEEKSKWQGIQNKLNAGAALSWEEREAIKKCGEGLDDEGLKDEEYELTDLEVVDKRLQQCELILSGVGRGVDTAERMGLTRYVEVPDSIFVRYTDQAGQPVDHAEISTFSCSDCAEVIRKKHDFAEYEKLIDSFAFINKFAELHARDVTHAINSYLIMAFVLGDMNALYPLDGSRRQMKRILSIDADKYEAMAGDICKDKDIAVKEDGDKRKILFRFAVDIIVYSKNYWRETDAKMDWEPVLNLSDTDKTFLIENAAEFLAKLPIYKHLEETAKKLFLYNGNMTEKGNLRMPPKQDKQWDLFFWEPEQDKLYPYIYIKGEKGWEPSPYFKLFYHYERIESPKMREIYKELKRNYEFYALCAQREQDCINLVEAFQNYREVSGSENKRIFEQWLNTARESNRKVEEKYIEKGRNEWDDKEVWSWYAQIFDTRNTDGRRCRKKNWNYKNVVYEDETYTKVCELIPYAGNNNDYYRGMYEKILLSTGIRKRMDYWSYNLLKEMLDIRACWNLNPELKKIFADSDSDYGFDWESIGIRPEELKGDMDSLTRDFLSTISPWLFGRKDCIGMQ